MPDESKTPATQTVATEVTASASLVIRVANLLGVKTKDVVPVTEEIVKFASYEFQMIAGQLHTNSTVIGRWCLINTLQDFFVYFDLKEDSWNPPKKN
jgi:hypothetical protein